MAREDGQLDIGLSPSPPLAFLQKILSEDARQSCPNYFRFSADCKENNPKQF